MRFDLSCRPQVGRGTSTHDGLAIAYATLRHLATAKVPTMFVTHYPLLSRLADELAGVANYHMAFVEEDEQEQAQEETAGAGANTGFFFCCCRRQWRRACLLRVWLGQVLPRRRLGRQARRR